MRTVDDLQAAFALLERQADAYSPDVVLLQAAGSSRRRRRPAVWLTAAAVAAALAVTGTVVWNATRTGTNPSGGSGEPAPVTIDQLNVPFRLANSTGLTVVQSQVAGGQSYFLADRSHKAQLMLFDTQPPRYDSAVPVDINGVTGSYADEANEPHPAPATTVMGQTPSPATDVQWPRDLTWRYGPRGWATLVTQGPPMSKADLLKAARGLDFSLTTKLRTPFSLAAAPNGLELTQVNLMPRAVGEEPPFDLKTSTWYADLMYSSPDHRFGVEVNLTAAKPNTRSGLSVGPWTKDATPMRVGARDGYWSASLNTLSVQLGPDTYLNLLQTGTESAALTSSAFVNIAQTVTVVPNPQDRSTWFDAATALPLN